MVKPPLRFEGFLLYEITGYEGWLYTEEDLEDIAKLVKECGLEATPVFQLIFSMAGIHGTKAAGYLTWVRRGKPGKVERSSEQAAEEAIAGP